MTKKFREIFSIFAYCALLCRFRFCEYEVTFYKLNYDLSFWFHGILKVFTPISMYIFTVLILLQFSPSHFWYFCVGNVITKQITKRLFLRNTLLGETEFFNFPHCEKNSFQKVSQINYFIACFNYWKDDFTEFAGNIMIRMRLSNFHKPRIITFSH